LLKNRRYVKPKTIRAKGSQKEKERARGEKLLGREGSRRDRAGRKPHKKRKKQ